MIFALVVIRGLSNSLKSEDAFIRLASAGLIVLFGVQSVINMAVNLNLMPAKGMTLPFISYGGSSMVAVAFGMGLLLAFTRRRPEPRRVPPRIAPADRRRAQSPERRWPGSVLLCAGGTGGHLFPAEALAIALAARGWRVHLATDHRVETYGQRLSGRGDPHHPVGDA